MSSSLTDEIDWEASSRRMSIANELEEYGWSKWFGGGKPRRHPTALELVCREFWPEDDLIIVAAKCGTTRDEVLSTIFMYR